MCDAGCCYCEYLYIVVSPKFAKGTFLGVQGVVILPHVGTSLSLGRVLVVRIFLLAYPSLMTASLGTVLMLYNASAGET